MLFLSKYMSFELFLNIIQDGNFLTHADKSWFTLSVVHNIPTDEKPEKNWTCIMVIKWQRYRCVKTKHYT